MKKYLNWVKKNQYIRALNEGALLNPKVTTIAQDAMTYLIENDALYDVIIADLPDPSNDALARLYSTSFYKLIQNHLSPYGVFATQASSPFHTRNAFWCIMETLEASGFKNIYPYRTYIPSFGDWGFILASNLILTPKNFEIDRSTRYLDENLVKEMFFFPKDIANPGNLDVNRLDQPNLLHYFLEDWEEFSKERKN